MQRGICINCAKEKDVALSGRSKGLCKVCYCKLIWKRKKIECKRCKKMKFHQAFGFCPGCYNSVFHIEVTRAHNAKRRHNIGIDLYKKVIEKCVSCGFDKIVELHHLDHNRKNNSEKNLVGLCPNCHKMLHSKKYQKDIFEALEKQGFETPKTRGYEMDGFFKK